MTALDRDARRLINRFQGGFPIVRRPFLQVAAMLGMTESALISLVTRLLEQGYLSRFGPLFDAGRMGGRQILAAMAVPQKHFPAICDLVNGFDAVAHNYRREHPLNMWFVISAESAEIVERTAVNIERLTGLPVYRFPKEHEFYVGLFLRMDAEGGVETVSRELVEAAPGYVPTRFDRSLIVCCQEGLPLTALPYDEIATRLDTSPQHVMQRLENLLRHGVIRRIGAVPHHYRLGLRANGMTVWDVADSHAVALGRRVGALPFVSHSYLRPRHPAVWPYNLFAMVHGADRQAVERKRAEIAQLLGRDCTGNDVLYSSAVLKKTGLKLAA